MTSGTRGLTGRCYCGATSLRTTRPADVVAYCHCTDCRRWTGAALPAFAAFPSEALAISPKEEGASASQGVTRWICRRCGSGMAAAFDYLPGQIYVPVGIIDQAADLAPSLHCHAQNALPWLCLHDSLTKKDGSARQMLTEAKTR